MRPKTTTLNGLSPAVLAATLSLAFAAANANAAASKISTITLYPGSATIEREIRLPAGSTRIEVSCLPASFDPDSLRVIAPQGVQLGDFRIDDTTAGDDQSITACETTSRDKRIRALQAQLGSLNARADAIELSAAYLKSASEQKADTGGPSSMLGVSRALEQSGFDVYAKRADIKRQQEATQKQLSALNLDADGPVPTRTLRIALDAPRGGLLKIAYETQRAGWIPAYQASLDSSGRQIVLERRALVAQATGEDWHGVKLQLSTGTSVKTTGAPQPQEWQLRLLTPRPKSYGAMVMGQAPVPPAPPMTDPRANANAPLFTPHQIEGNFLTKFEVPGNIDVPYDAQKVGFTLASESLSAKLVVRLTPRESTRAWLVATAARPDGVWPDGNVQLRRDGAHVGETNWSNALQDSELVLPFGPDEQVSVSKADGPDATGTSKSFGGTASKTISTRYTIRNLHRTPIDVEIVEATPVSDSADIKVTSKFAPQPDDLSWHDRQGMVAWKKSLDGGQQTSVSASYTVQYPGEQTIVGLP